MPFKEEIASEFAVAAKLTPRGCVLFYASSPKETVLNTDTVGNHLVLREIEHTPNVGLSR